MERELQANKNEQTFEYIRYKKHFSRTSVYQGLKKKKKSKILCFVLAKQAMLLKNS